MPYYNPIDIRPRNLLDYYDINKQGELQREQMAKEAQINQAIAQQQAYRDWQAMLAKGQAIPGEPAIPAQPAQGSIPLWNAGQGLLKSEIVSPTSPDYQPAQEAKPAGPTTYRPFYDEYGQLDLGSVSQSPEFKTFAQEHPEFATAMQKEAGLFGGGKVPELGTDFKTFLEQNYPGGPIISNSALKRAISWGATPEGRTAYEAWKKRKQEEASKGTGAYYDQKAYFYQKLKDEHKDWSEEKLQGEASNMALQKTKVELPAQATTATTNAKLEAIDVSNEKKWALLDEPSKQMLYNDFINTGKVPPIFQSRTGSMSKAALEFYKGAAAYAKSKGIEPEDVNVQRAIRSANEIDLKQQKRSLGLMNQFAGNITLQINKVEKIFKELDRVGIRATDVPLRELKTRIKGSGLEKTAESYLLEISNEIGKLSTGSQASVAELSVGAQEKWSKIHDPSLSLKELKIILDATKEQAEMRVKSANDTIKQATENLKSGKLGYEPIQAPESEPTSNIPAGIFKKK